MESEPSEKKGEWECDCALLRHDGREGKSRFSSKMVSAKKQAALRYCLQTRCKGAAGGRDTEARAAALSRLLSLSR